MYAPALVGQVVFQNMLRRLRRPVNLEALALVREVRIQVHWAKIGEHSVKADCLKKLHFGN